MTDAWRVVIGSMQGDVWSAVAAGTDARLNVNTSFTETSGPAQGTHREYLPDSLEWELSAECLLKTGGNDLKRGERVRWAIQIGDDTCYGDGEVSQLSESGGVKGKARVSVTIKGTGELAVAGDWILRNGWWDDHGRWYDDDHWIDGASDT